jgi:ABC-type antimicrobial peptide transport system permease subunit
MTGTTRQKFMAWPLVLVAAVAAMPVQAYAGPGAGLSMIGSLVALVGALLAGIFGFVWFPVKRMLKKRKASQADAALPPTKPNETQR